MARTNPVQIRIKGGKKDYCSEYSTNPRNVPRGAKIIGGFEMNTGNELSKSEAQELVSQTREQGAD